MNKARVQMAFLHNMRAEAYNLNPEHGSRKLGNKKVRCGGIVDFIESARGWA
jgi:hypothetical protein